MIFYPDKQRLHQSWKELRVFLRIERIKNFGVFNDFSGAGLEEFAPFNLIYGWNYSGKTTLSRMFRCFEKQELHPDYQEAKFSLVDSDNITHSQSFGVRCNVRVFNEDFRKEHLQWDDADGLNPILIVGAENIAARSELEAKEAELKNLEEERSVASQESKRLLDKINSAETDCAKQIANELPVGRFTKVNLRPIIDGWDGKIPVPLDEGEFKKESAKVTSERRDLVLNLEIRINSIDELWRRGLTLLDRDIYKSTVIERLTEDPDLGRWVEQGMSIHKGKSTCEFCEGELTPERIAKLNAHFSREFEELKEELSEVIDDVTKCKVVFDENYYSKVLFYADLQDEFSDAKKDICREVHCYNSLIEELLRALAAKRDNPFNFTISPMEYPNKELIVTANKKFQNVIDRNNERTNLFVIARNRAIETLKNHYAAQAMLKIDLPSLLHKKIERDNQEQAASQRLPSISQEISDLRAKLSNATKGADAINETLERFFGKADIQVIVTPDDRFLLKRGDAHARNLSEGERTAIAFCYFVTKLLENDNDLTNTIVYIDDPISSLDSNHLLHLVAFIKNTFYQFNATAPKHRCLAAQLFVSTHSHDFFHLMWDWMNSMNNGMYRSYLVERTDANGSISSQIIECPASITKYRSEYLFLFDQIASYVASPVNDQQIIFNLGNMTRRFVEGYAAFKFLEFTSIDRSIRDLINDPIDAERARKFMHFYSHTLSRGGGMRLPDMSEAQAVIRLILNAVREHDPIHYDALERARDAIAA